MSDIIRRRLAVLSSLLLLAPLALLAQEPDGDLVNRIVLRVNDRIATLFDYQRQLATIRAELSQQAGMDPQEQRQLLENAPREVMRSVFDELLMLSRADQLGIIVSELELEEAIEQRMQRLEIPDRQQLALALAQSGMTLAEFRSNLRNQMLWQRVTQQELFSRIDVQDEKLREIYRDRRDDFSVPERRRLREIVILEGEQSETDRRKMAEAVRERWSGGEDPEALVAEHGEEALTLLDVGWISRGDLAPELEAVVFELDAGTVSEPVSARGGLHVATVLEFEERSVRPFEEVRAQLLAQERSRRFEGELEEYLKELEEKAYWDYHPLPGLEDFRTASGRVVRQGQRNLLGAEPVAPVAESAEDESGVER